jgi:hypothetical protein
MIFFVSSNPGAKNQRSLLKVFGQNIGIRNGWVGLSSGNQESVEELTFKKGFDLTCSDD